MNTTQATSAPAYIIYELERRAYPVIDECAIGRDSTNDLVIPEPTVSRTHARVTRSGDALTLENSGATGTRVNGLPVLEPRTLSNGDRIDIGTATLTVRKPPLPIGVSIVDRVRGAPVGDPIGSKRVTIRNPLLGGQPQETRKKPAIGPWVLLGVVLLVVLAVLLR